MDGEIICITNCEIEIKSITVLLALNGGQSWLRVMTSGNNNFIKHLFHRLFTLLIYTSNNPLQIITTDTIIQHSHITHPYVEPYHLSQAKMFTKVPSIHKQLCVAGEPPHVSTLDQKREISEPHDLTWRCEPQRFIDTAMNLWKRLFP